jgi:hypothetical protein
MYANACTQAHLWEVEDIFFGARSSGDLILIQSILDLSSWLI